MQLKEIDYWWKELVCKCDGPETPTRAFIKVTQPQGYTQTMAVGGEAMTISDGSVEIRLLYPLIDEGRYDCSHRSWNGQWEMGQYHFETILYHHDTEIGRDSLELDPHSFFPSDRMPIAVDARTQIIECAPTQPVYVNRERSEFMIRIRRQRVSQCAVQVDITKREGDHYLAGPWLFSLTDQYKKQQFSIADWPTGEYWIRIRAMVNGQEAGPYCVRKFWVQRSQEPVVPEVMEFGGYPNVMVDDYTLESTHGIQFVPVPMEKQPDKPLLEIDKPYEDEYVLAESLTWNQEKKRYECIYHNRSGSSERMATQPQRQHLKMLLISQDGNHWDKPNLGLVEFEGSCENNIVSDVPDEIAEQEKAHDIEHAEFEFYDAQKHGSVTFKNVFVASGKRTHFPFECKSLQNEAAAEALRKTERGHVRGFREDGLGVLDVHGDDVNNGVFRPNPGEFWPMEKRGDMYVVLTREPVLCLGVGMDLKHTTEIIHCHTEQVGAYGPVKLMWYFRPGAPAYPPHGATYDNMHLTLRCLGVLWTEDGLNYHRQFVLETDEYDRIGTQFYYMGLLQKMGTSGDVAGRPVLDKIAPSVIACQAFPKRNLYLGTVVLHWGIEQKQAPELIWSRDLLHFHRFKKNRRALIELGQCGTYNAGMIRDQFRYCEFDNEWWYPYTAVNTRHNGYMVLHRFEDVDTLRQKFPNQADAPYFPTWEAYYLYGKQTRYLPSLARCRPFRVACAEPTEAAGQGELTTRPILVDGGELRINAQTGPSGSIDLEVLDDDGNALLKAPTFVGDEVDKFLADLSSWSDQSVRLRFTLRNARLFAFTLVTENDSRHGQEIS